MSEYMQELLDKKSNIFDHILYEFEMYINTYCGLQSILQKNTVEKLLRNVFLESHAVHLRNLIEFFNCADNSITTKTIFSGDYDMSYDDSTIEAKKIINKAIDHLTKERITWNQTEKDLTLRFAEIVHTMFKNVMLSRIKESVNLLIEGTAIQPDYLKDLHSEDIQRRLKYLSDTCIYCVRAMYEL